jgi:uncharacterized paraquat-inducible protein A
LLYQLRSAAREIERTNGDARGSVMSKMTSCPACGAMISADANACPRCGATFNRTIGIPVGLAIMLAIAFLYVLLQRYF